MVVVSPGSVARKTGQGMVKTYEIPEQLLCRIRGFEGGYRREMIPKNDRKNGPNFRHLERGWTSRQRGVKKTKMSL